MIVDHGIASVISVYNIGTAKATDISVVIEFPDEIRVLDINEVRELNEPKAPEKPRNLLDIAYERAHRELSIARMFAPSEQLGSARALNWPDLSAYAMRNSVFESLDIFDNKVNIEIKSGIVHTKKNSFRDIYIVAMKKGNFKAKATFMCAEYENPDKIELTFICE